MRRRYARQHIELLEAKPRLQGDVGRSLEVVIALRNKRRLLNRCGHNMNDIARLAHRDAASVVRTADEGDTVHLNDGAAGRRSHYWIKSEGRQLDCRVEKVCAMLRNIFSARFSVKF